MLPITEDMYIDHIMRTYPETREVFLAYGLACPDCLGASGARLREGATMHGIDLEELILALNDAVRRGRSRPPSG